MVFASMHVPFRESLWGEGYVQGVVCHNTCFREQQRWQCDSRLEREKHNSSQMKQKQQTADATDSPCASNLTGMELRRCSSSGPDSTPAFASSACAALTKSEVRLAAMSTTSDRLWRRCARTPSAAATVCGVGGGGGDSQDRAGWMARQGGRAEGGDSQDGAGWAQGGGARWRVERVGHQWWEQRGEGASE